MEKQTLPYTMSESNKLVQLLWKAIWQYLSKCEITRQLTLQQHANSTSGNSS